MKSIAILAFASLSSLAFAGQPVMTDSKKTVVPPEPCFADKELQLDVYGLYNWYEGNTDDGWGGGLSLNYFFHRNIGLSADANVSDAGGDAAWNFGLNVIARFPVEVGGVCLAPYIKGGGGYHTDGFDDWFVTAGGGLEFRLTPRIGIFGEGTYNWSDGEDFTQARAGLRFVF